MLGKRCPLNYNPKKELQKQRRIKLDQNKLHLLFLLLLVESVVLRGANGSAGAPTSRMKQENQKIAMHTVEKANSSQ